MFQFVFLVQPDNNVCQNFPIKTNYKSDCAISTRKVSKKRFAKFDSFAKMKLVPNVRDINDTKQIWLQADRYLHGDCMDMNCPITISMIHAVTVLRPELKKSSNLLQKSLEPFIIHSSYLTAEWINIFLLNSTYES